jgi:hypothetical protein
VPIGRWLSYIARTNSPTRLFRSAWLVLKSKTKK